MSVTVVQNSRLRFHELVSVDEVEFWNLAVLPEVPPQYDDIQYQIQMNDRIDLLAFKFYRDSVLWWVIAKANGMDLIPVNFFDGQIIRIPSPRYVSRILFKKAKRR